TDGGVSGVLIAQDVPVAVGLSQGCSPVGTLHEFAHGLTCKHYGGEVREIGFLLMYFMPCFYCNVSDAWLFRHHCCSF
ncbi:MAG: hypothetical protein P8X91_07795, partial [Candidatus Bathyarchaeota archaeon]